MGHVHTKLLIERSLSNLYAKDLLELCGFSYANAHTDPVKIYIVYDWSTPSSILETLQTLIEHRGYSCSCIELLLENTQCSRVLGMQDLMREEGLALTAALGRSSKDVLNVLVVIGSLPSLQLASMCAQIYKYSERLSLLWLPTSISAWLNALRAQLYEETSFFAALSKDLPLLGLSVSVAPNCSLLFLDVLVKRHEELFYRDELALLLFSLESDLLVRLMREHWSGLLDGNAHSYKACFDELFLLASYGSTRSGISLSRVFERVCSECFKEDAIRSLSWQDLVFLQIYTAELLVRTASTFKLIDSSSSSTALEMLADLSVAVLEHSKCLKSEDLETLRERFYEGLLASIVGILQD